MTITYDTDFDSEAAILGAMLINHTALRIGLELLDPEDFANERHRVVFASCRVIAEGGKSVDEQIVVNDLRASGKLAVAGGASRVLDLSQQVPTVVNARHYAADVRQAAMRRRLREALFQAAKDEANAPTFEDALSRVEHAVFEIRDASTHRERRAGKPIADLAVDMLGSFYETAPKHRIPFPLDELNRIGGGQVPGQVIVTGGYSGDGKTWWALDCVEIAAQAGERVAVFSMEMSANELTERLTAMGGHNYTNIVTQRTNPEAIAPRANAIAGWDVTIFDGSTTVSRIRSELVRAKLAGKPYTYVVVDHLHLMRMPGGTQGYRIALNDALAEMKALANEQRVVLHLLAQLNRGEAREFPPPRLSAFKESGAIEQIADYALFVWRERDANGRQLPEAQIIIAKVRAGKQIPPVPVVLDERQMRFVPRPFSARPVVAA